MSRAKNWINTYVSWMHTPLYILLAGALACAHAGIQVVATPTELQSFFGTSAVKLAFVESKQIQVIDFAPAAPAASTLAGTNGAIAPQFSPDGHWLVYGQGPSSDMTNNAATKSSAYLVPTAGGTPTLAVADNAHEPRFRRTGASTELVYATLGVWDGWKGLGETRTLPVDLSAPTVQLGVESTLASGSYYGGANDSYLATGSSRAVMAKLSDAPLVPQITLAYPLSKSDGSLDNLERQACNISIYPGTEFSDVMMSLDFGSAGQTNAQINGGKAWGMHDLLFMTRYDGTILGQILRPARSDFPSLADDSYTGHHFDDAEWSNHPYFAVANIQVSRAFPDAGGGWINEEQHEIILAIDLRLGTTLVLAQSSQVGPGLTADLQWPNLWVDRSSANVPSVTSDWMQKMASPVRAPTLSQPSGALRIIGQNVFSSEPLASVVSYDLRGHKRVWSSSDGFVWSLPTKIHGVQLVVAAHAIGSVTVRSFQF